jgi:hypothetical protein
VSKNARNSMLSITYRRVSREWGKSPGGFGDRSYRSAAGRQKMAEFHDFRSDFERMLHLRARTFAHLQGGVRKKTS